MIANEPCEINLCIVDSGGNYDYNAYTFAKAIKAHHFACCLKSTYTVEQ